MPCLRFDLRRLFPLYLDGAAPAREVERIEAHLLDCQPCRARLVRMREARALLGGLPHMNAAPYEWLMAHAPARAEAKPVQRRRRAGVRFVRHFAADALVASALFAVFTLLYTHTASARNRPFDFSSFQAMDVRQVATTDDPHVIVNGVVTTATGEFDNEGSHRFRLVDPRDPQSFVVCEILDGDAIAPPAPGARVRVWGVSRYDSSPDHRWFEIHPVLKVEVVR